MGRKRIHPWRSNHPLHINNWFLVINASHTTTNSYCRRARTRDMDCVQKILMNTNNCSGTILFCEADARIIQAAHQLQAEENITVILVGDKQAYQQAAAHQNHLEGIEILPVNPQLYADTYYEKRKHKQISKEDALSACNDPVTFSCLHLLAGHADTLVCGATWPSKTTFKPALQLLSDGVASTYFLMDTDKGEYLFGDCALNIQPDSKQLAQIAINTATAAQRMDMTPKVAMLSFSTKGSAKHPDQEKVTQATKIVTDYIKDHNKDWVVSGEIQVDAALNQEVAQHKAPTSLIQGDANILIFPDLDAANIGYKLVQQFSGCKAIGPFTSGLSKEVNDLSRGASTQEIIETAKRSLCNASRY